jgi:hypothetical protein
MKRAYKQEKYNYFTWLERIARDKLFGPLVRFEENKVL